MCAAKLSYSTAIAKALQAYNRDKELEMPRSRIAI